jgi:hypothetical protein
MNLSNGKVKVFRTFFDGAGGGLKQAAFVALVIVLVAR